MPHGNQTYQLFIKNTIKEAFEVFYMLTTTKWNQTIYEKEAQEAPNQDLERRGYKSIAGHSLDAYHVHVHMKKLPH